MPFPSRAACGARRSGTRRTKRAEGRGVGGSISSSSTLFHVEVSVFNRELAVQEASIDNYTLSRSGWLQRDRPLRCPMQLKLESRSPFISSHRSTVFPPHGVSVRGASQLQHISNTVPHAARLGSPTSSRSELQIKKRMEERKRPAYHRLWKLAPPHSHRTFARTLLTLPPYLSWDCGSPRGTYPVMLLNIPVKKLRPSRYHPQQQRRTDTE
ncbi:hypothetical protein EXN66_Car008237 [Channa argus]|uniref:Uncharacterized protein n=1 Tax=Channa argus TaxID=215402 RepID=A0A6G1PQD6_CHAAH|nr:hypothetical protein EXN66_Car008237 [Channa argus]